MKSELRAIREREGVVQAHLAREANLSDTTIRKAERGRIVTPVTLNRILKALNKLAEAEYEITDVWPEAKLQAPPSDS